MMINPYAFPPVASGYRYFKVTVKGLRDNSKTFCQMAEFNIYDAGGRLIGNPIVSTEVNNPGYFSGEGPENVNDADVDTKLNMYTIQFGTGAGNTWFRFDFGTAKLATYYTWTTANDETGRDMLRWTLEGSNDDSTWTMLDDRSGSDQSVTTSRKTIVGTFTL